MSISLEESQDLARIMGIKYTAALQERFFELQVSQDAELVQVKVILRNQDQSFYYPVEGRIQHREQNLAPREAALLLIDYIDTYFEEYLREDEEVFLPIDWNTYACEGFDFQLRGQVLNLKCEALADQLLEGKKPLMGLEG